METLAFVQAMKLPSWPTTDDIPRFSLSQLEHLGLSGLGKAMVFHVIGLNGNVGKIICSLLVEVCSFSMQARMAEFSGQAVLDCRNLWTGNLGAAGLALFKSPSGGGLTKMGSVTF